MHHQWLQHPDIELKLQQSLRAERPKTPPRRIVGCSGFLFLWFFLLLFLAAPMPAHPTTSYTLRYCTLEALQPSPSDFPPVLQGTRPHSALRQYPRMTTIQALPGAPSAGSRMLHALSAMIHVPDRSTGIRILRRLGRAGQVGMEGLFGSLARAGSAPCAKAGAGTVIRHRRLDH